MSVYPPVWQVVNFSDGTALVEKWIARTDPQSYRRKDAVIVVVCPLIALMEDQIARLNSIGLKAAYIGNNQTEDVLRAIENGEYTFVFVSPEFVSV